MLVIEMTSIKGEITVRTAKRLINADRLYGLSAIVLIALGVLRVLYFEKGPSYYLNSAPFIIKMVLFVVVGVLSIYPTRIFMQWRKMLANGSGEALDATKLKRVSLIVHLELLGIAGILLCAVLMAKGIGYML